MARNAEILARVDDSNVIGYDARTFTWMKVGTYAHFWRAYVDFLKLKRD